ncbi:hypothetical protein F5141DRAFT_391087 [Pisolithus sp. B1]|nr:hypothetical protein F5141DRAFT_391087 [Pisolithus sp. B1]
MFFRGPALFSSIVSWWRGQVGDNHLAICDDYPNRTAFHRQSREEPAVRIPLVVKSVHLKLLPISDLHQRVSIITSPRFIAAPGHVHQRCLSPRCRRALCRCVLCSLRVTLSKGCSRCGCGCDSMCGCKLLHFHWLIVRMSCYSICTGDIGKAPRQW